MRNGWGILWREDSRLDGKWEHLMETSFAPRFDQCPVYMSGYPEMVFRTRQLARDYIETNYGYIRNRPDLQSEPHGWKVPVPVKVKVVVSVVS